MSSKYRVYLLGSETHIVFSPLKMAAQSVTLYYFPSSYYSLKVLLALYEKGIPFKERIVNLLANEQNEDWYLRMNRNGEVPVLELGEEHISESEVIIDVIDQTFTSGPTLVPNLETSEGQTVRELRIMLDAIDIGVITFGVLSNRKFCAEDITDPVFSKFDKKRVEQYYEGGYKRLILKKKSSSPEIQPTIDRKAERYKEKLTTIFDESKVAKCLDDLEQVFDKLEDRLNQSKQNVDNAAQEYWLTGTDFTAADITATIAMISLSRIGMSSRYFSDTKRPLVYEYYIRLLKRPAVQKTVSVLNSLSSYMIRQTLKTYSKKILKIGVVLGLLALGYAGYKKYSNIRRGLAKA